MLTVTKTNRHRAPAKGPTVSPPIDRLGSRSRDERLSGVDIAGRADALALSDLLDRWRRRTDVAAATRILGTHLPLVVAVAAEFDACGFDRQDLIGAGNSGLVRAMNRFDGTDGLEFSDYARWWIRVAIRGHILANRRGGGPTPRPVSPGRPVSGIATTAVWC